MRTDSNFKMPKNFKSILGGIKNPEMRLLWKRSFIEAAIAERGAKMAKYVELKSSKGD